MSNLRVAVITLALWFATVAWLVAFASLGANMTELFRSASYDKNSNQTCHRYGGPSHSSMMVCR